MAKGDASTRWAGVSTGAVAPGDVHAGLVAAHRAGAGVVELSALHESELDSVEDALTDVAADGFDRVSVHGPAKGRVLPEPVLAGRLHVLGVPVVMHPDVLIDLDVWARLGGRLLVENNDSRKRFGGRVADLSAMFEAVPHAGFCLDVSHALDVGGLTLVTALADAFAGRLVQLHAGCGCGRVAGPLLEPDVLAAVRRVGEVTGSRVPVISERPTPAGHTATIAAQVRALEDAW